MNKHLRIVIAQGIFLIIVVSALYFMYPRAEVDVNGNSVRFSSINANVIMISENPDFSNPRYIDLTDIENISFNLNPGKYYWKSDNGIISGFKNEFTIDSKVGLSIIRTENESDLVNVGNVKIKVSKSDNGVMVGHIILEPEESENISDKENEGYTGGQTEWNYLI